MGAGAVITGDEAWQWSSSNPAPVTGNVAHASTINAGLHQHYFYNASQTLPVGENDSLYTYVYLDPNNPPSQVMLQWHEASTGWDHRAYWGASQIPWGVENTASRRYMGSLPATGGWVRLEVPASLVGLDGQTINGMAFTLYGGRAWWDRAGKVLSTREYFFNGQHIATRQGNALYYLHSSHLGSIHFATDANGDRYGDDFLSYRAYGYDYDASELPTDYNFTGQKMDDTGLMYYGARYYDPQIGTFISPDTLVPDPTHVFDYNRYMYARGNPIQYNDPTGHCAATALAGPPGLAFDIPCWASGAGEAAVVGAGAVAVGVAATDLAVDYVLGEPALDYAPLYPQAGISDGNLSITIPVAGSTTLTTGGVPLLSEENSPLAGTAPQVPTQQVLADPLITLQMGSNIVEAQIVQRGGRTFSTQAAKRLNEANGVDYHSRDYGRALEYIKGSLTIRGDNHSSRIYDDGNVEYEMDGSWQEVGNLFDWID